MLYDFIFLLRNPYLRRRTLSQWLLWVFLTITGWTLAGLSGLPVGRVVIAEGSIGVIFSVSLTMGLLGTLIGGLIGAGQWFFLRRRVVGAAYWVPATALGWGFGLPMALLVNLLAGLGLSAALYGLIIGATVSAMQWALCQKVIVRPWRWGWANLIGMPVGIFSAGILERSLLESLPVMWGLSSWRPALTGAVAGLFVGFFTGIVLVVMLSTRDSQEAD